MKVIGLGSAITATPTSSTDRLAKIGRKKWAIAPVGPDETQAGP